MNAFIFTLQADADAVSASVDARAGYPKNGIDVGGGAHATRVASMTLRHGAVIKHPTLPLWRYPDDATVRGEVARGLVIPITGASQALDGTWPI